MISSLKGPIELALSRWKFTAAAAEKCGWKEGFADMVINYSVREFKYRRGNQSQGGRGSAEHAEKPFQITGRQFHFIAQGTIWLDMLGDWMEGHGQRRIAGRRDHTGW